MSIRIQAFSKSSAEKGMQITICGPVARISIRVDSQLSARARKEVGLSFLKQIKPWLKYFTTYRASFPGENWLPRWDRGTWDEGRETGVRTPLEQQGFEFRMDRLNLGLSQIEIAKRVGTTACRISLVERGLTRARPALTLKIQAVLQNASNDLFTTDSAIRHER